jgi:hypothetical protein
MESLKFTSKSDVWSFAILMFEVLSDAMKPYPELKTNDLVIGAVSRGYRMPRHPSCDPHLYEMMLLCWSSDPSERPSFFEISKYMQIRYDAAKEDDGKNIGFWLPHSHKSVVDAITERVDKINPTASGPFINRKDAVRAEGGMVNPAYEPSPEKMISGKPSDTYEMPDGINESNISVVSEYTDFSGTPMADNRVQTRPNTVFVDQIGVSRALLRAYSDDDANRTSPRASAQSEQMYLMPDKPAFKPGERKAIRNDSYERTSVDSGADNMYADFGAAGGRRESYSAKQLAGMVAAGKRRRSSLQAAAAANGGRRKSSWAPALVPSDGFYEVPSGLPSTLEKPDGGEDAENASGAFKLKAKLFGSIGRAGGKLKRLFASSQPIASTAKEDPGYGRAQDMSLAAAFGGGNIDPEDYGCLPDRNRADQIADAFSSVGGDVTQKRRSSLARLEDALAAIQPATNTDHLPSASDTMRTRARSLRQPRHSSSYDRAISGSNSNSSSTRSNINPDYMPEGSTTSVVGTTRMKPRNISTSFMGTVDEPDEGMEMITLHHGESSSRSVSEMVLQRTVSNLGHEDAEGDVGGGSDGGGGSLTRKKTAPKWKKAALQIKTAQAFECNLRRQRSSVTAL